jgi:hypothetical protein
VTIVGLISLFLQMEGCVKRMLKGEVLQSLAGGGFQERATKSSCGLVPCAGAKGAAEAERGHLLNLSEIRNCERDLEKKKEDNRKQGSQIESLQCTLQDVTQSMHELIVQEEREGGGRLQLEENQMMEYHLM